MATSDPPFLFDATAPPSEIQASTPPLFAAIPTKKKAPRSGSTGRTKLAVVRRIFKARRNRSAKRGPSPRLPEADQRIKGPFPAKVESPGAARAAGAAVAAGASASASSSSADAAEGLDKFAMNLVSVVEKGNVGLFRKYKDRLRGLSNIPATILSDALRQASFYGELEMVRILLENTRVDVNARSYVSGMTALMLASQAGHRGVVRYLSRNRRVDANVANHNGLTALHWALLHGRLEIAKELVFNAKADIGWDGDGRDATFFYRYDGVMDGDESSVGKQLVDRIFAAAKKLRPLRRDVPMLAMLHQDILRATLDI